MPTPNEEIQDEITKHQVYILRLSTTEANTIIGIIDSSRVAVAGILSLGLPDITSGVFTASQNQQIERLARKVSRVRGGKITEAEKWYTGEMRDLITHEIAYAEGLLVDHNPVVMAYDIPNIPKTQKRLIQNGTYQGATISDWFGSMRANDAARVLSTIRVGVSQGLTNEEIVRSIVGTRANNYADGVVNITRNDARRLTRTVTNGIANDAREQFYKENADILAGEIYVATLDGRTTIICMTLDGKIYPVGEGEIPPVHYNCRSTRAPVVDDVRLANIMGERPFVRDTRTRRKREIDFRAQAKAEAGDRWRRFGSRRKREEIAKIRREWTRKNVGQAPSKQTYPQWLKKQSKAFQNEVLGKTRAEAWRSGKMELGNFVDRSGKTLTLEQLKLQES